MESELSVRVLGSGVVFLYVPGCSDAALQMHVVGFPGFTVPALPAISSSGTQVKNVVTVAMVSSCRFN